MSHNQEGLCSGEDDGHDHSRGAHDHSDDITPAIQNLLYDQIDFDGIRTLNEKISGSGRAIIRKTWAQREGLEPELESDVDEQIILHVPFTGQVRLHSIHIRTSPSDSAPLTLHLHSNREDFDFDTIDPVKPTQTVTLSQTSNVQEIPVKRQLFNACHHLALFFEENHGNGEEDTTRLSYLAFKGDFMRLSREPVEVLYEAASRPSDHKIKGQAADVGGGFGGIGSRSQGF